MERQTSFNLWYVIIALMAVVWLRDMWVGASQVQTIPYSEFQHHLKTGELDQIAISNNLIEGKLKKPTTDGRTRIVTTRVDPELARREVQRRYGKHLLPRPARMGGTCPHFPRNLDVPCQTQWQVKAA